MSPTTRCAVCKHSERPRIEALSVAGATLDALAEQFGLHRDALWRHMGRHVSDDKKVGYLLGAGKMAKLAEIAADENRSVIDYYSILRSALFYQLDRLAAKDDHLGVATIAGKLTDVLQQIAKITGQISAVASSTVINFNNHVAVINSPPFADLQSGLIQVCAKHPEARADILALFRDLDTRYGSPAPKLIDVTTAKEAALG